MKIILLSDVSKVGRKYDVKEVNSGHAQNFLIPKGLAVAATPEALKRLEKQRQELESEREIQEKLLLKNVSQLEGYNLSIEGKANDKGHLFAGLHAIDIVKALEKQSRINLDPASIVLSETIKTTGTHVIEVKMGGQSVKFNLEIKAVK